MKDKFSDECKFARRKGYSISGDPISIVSNHFLIETANPIWHIYEVSYDPPTNTKINKNVVRQLITMLDFGSVEVVERRVKSYVGYRRGYRGLIYYDGNKRLYTSRPLPRHGSFQIFLPHVENQIFRIIVQPVGQSDPHDHLEFLRRRQKDIPKDVIQALDLVLRKSKSTIGQMTSFTHGLQRPFNFYQCLTPTQMGVSLTIDISNSRTLSNLDPAIPLQFQLEAVKGQNSEIYLQNDFGSHVGHQRPVIDATVLPTPRLTYDNGGIEEHVYPMKGQWNMMNKKMVNGSSVASWACINFSKKNTFVVDRFLERLLHTCRNNGMTINSPVHYPYTFHPKEMDKVLTDLHQEWPGLELLIVILPDEDRVFYGRIKLKCETELGIVTQCCKPLSVSTCESKILQNLSLKINVKVGGRNTVLFDSLCRRVSNVCDLPTIIFGANLTRGNGSRKSSIAAVVASMDWPEFTKYRARVSAQPPSVDVIEDLYWEKKGGPSGTVFGGMIRDHLKEFERLTGSKPYKIIFYRAGVSEDNFSKVMNSEMTAIRQACTSLQDGYLPKVTYVVAQKSHHTRFYADDCFGNICNIPTGTVVDTKICHPTRFDFYLTSHAGNEGTSRPTHYHVLYDQNRFEADELFTLTYHLCYTYARCTRSVSIVPPIYYARLAASRARLYMEINDKMDQKIYLPRVMRKVIAVMFYC